MKEDHFIRISKKIRNQLIYYTYIELKKNLKSDHCLLINSMTPNELCDKYQKCSDYCVEKIEEYSSSTLLNNGIDNNNYYHISVTYSYLNNNCHMLVDNKNVDQYLGKNNIVGKYYKGNDIQIRTTADKLKHNMTFDKNNLEKKIIGQNKFLKQNRSIFSSLDITKNINIIDKGNNYEINEINQHLKNLNSNCNEEHFKKLINGKINNEKLLKIRKTNTQKLVNKNMIKLKNYCAHLILIKRKVNRKNTLQPNDMMEEPVSPIIRKKNKDKNHFRSGKEKPKFEDPPPILHSNVDFNLNQNSKIGSENKILYSIHGKLKSQTKINQNSYRLQVKKSIHKKNRGSIDKNEEKTISPKKPSPKKILSPKKINIHVLNSGPGIGFSKFFHVYTKKEKNNEEINIKKYISGSKIDIPINKRRQNHVNSTINNNSKQASNIFRLNNNINNVNNINNINNNNKKRKLKKSLTINKIFKFQAGEVLEKKISGLKLKENKNI